MFAENVKNTGTNHNKSYQLLSSAKMFWKASLINGVSPDQTALNTNNMDPDQTAPTRVVSSGSILYREHSHLGLYCLFLYLH